MKRPQLLFPIGDDRRFGDVEKRREIAVFDEAFAQMRHPLDDQPTRMVMGVTVNPKRLRFGFIACVSLFLLFALRATYLQIIKGDTYRALAEGNRVRIEYLPSLRGVIYDHSHRVLADNRPTFRLIGTPADLPKDEQDRVTLFTRVTSYLHISIAELLSRLANGDTHPYDAVVLAQDVPYDQSLAFLLVEDSFAGLTLEINTQRSYATKSIPTLSHILGYTGIVSEDDYATRHSQGYRRIDQIGKIGVESVYEDALRGTYGRKVIETDALGHEVSIVQKQDPVDGANLVLSIDTNLTSKIESIIKDVAGADMRAAVIVMDPRNGQLLALVSTPSYDANLFTQGIDQRTYQALLDDPNRPLFSRAISGEYPTGSTFKPIVAAAALSEGLIDRHTSFLSTGGLSVGPWFFPDWKSGGHGITNVTKAIAQSVNTFFYTIGGGYDTFAGLGVDRIVSYAAKFGWGSPLGIDLTGEASGFLPTKDWKQKTKGERWYIGDTYHLAIGQGDLLATPLQLAAATAVFANGGTLYEPHVGAALEKNGETIPMNSVILNNQVVDSSAINIVREGMRETVLSGSARSLQSLPVTMAGKTGTAQWSSTHKTHAWFTGFAPYENPELVVTVLVEEGGGGDVIAVPIARQIVQWWYSQYNVTGRLDAAKTP